MHELETAALDRFEVPPHGEAGEARESDERGLAPDNVVEFRLKFPNGLGVYFIAFRAAVLPEDSRFLGAGRETLRTVLPRLEPWLHLVFTVLGGQMAAVGVLVVAAAWRLSRRGMGGRPELVLLAAVGALSVGLMSAVNFVLASDSRWLLILPAGVWIFGLVLAVFSHSDAARIGSTEDKHAG